MKKMITNTRMAVMALLTMLAATAFFARPKLALANKRGENFIDSGFKILIVVVLAALLLAGLYLLFGDVIMPKLTERVTDLFNYTA